MEFSTICRVCMQPISLEYIDLDTPFNDATYFDCFNYCTKLEAKASDNLPKTICLSCANSMQIAFDFITVASESDSLFRECFDQLEDGEGEIKFITEDFNKIESGDLEDIIPKNLKNENNVTDEDKEHQETKKPIQQFIDVKKIENTEPLISVDKNHSAKIIDIKKLTKVVLVRSTDQTESIEYEIFEEYQPNCSPIASQSISDKVEIKEDRVKFLTKNTETQKSEKLYQENTMLSINNERKQRAEIIDMEEDTELCKVDEPNEDSVDAEFQTSANFGNNSLIDAAEKDHMNHQTGNIPGPYKCEQCDDSFSSPKDLKMHCSKKHKKFEDAWYCNLCGEAADSRADLTLHRNNDHRNQTPGLCITCGCSFPDQNALTIHVTKEHWSRKRPAECPYCMKKFQLQTLPMHVRYVHFDIVRDSIKKEFSCKYCFDHSEDNEMLEEHIKLHTGINDYSCEICGEDFIGKRVFEKHKEKMHPAPIDERNFKNCPKCDFITSDEVLLSKHKKRHYNDEYYEANLKRFTKNKKRLRQYKCTFCPRKFNNPISLDNHVDYIHVDKKTAHQCDKCEKKYWNKCSLRNHQQSAHEGEESNKANSLEIAKEGEPLYSCEICGQNFKRKRLFEKHKELIHPAPISEKNIKKCPKCDFITSEEILLLRHKKRHYNDDYYRTHLKRYTNTNTNTKQKRLLGQYLCSFCPQKFNSPKSVESHEDFKHGEKKNALQCDLCDKKYWNKCSLRSHKLSAHGVARPFVCKECPKAFKLRTQLSQHVRIHSKKKIECPHCDKRFLLPCYLKIHLRTHTNELPYECHLCDKKFAIRVRLTYHLAKHEGTVFKCEYCPETFISQPKLRVHRFEHIGYPFVCDHCQEKYHRRIGFARHMRRAHGLIFTEADINENRFRNVKKIYGRTNSDTEPDPEEKHHPQQQPDIEI